jgi:hypothetical protein
MAVITRFSPGPSAAEILADQAVAGASDVANATSRGYPASVTNIGFTKIREFSNTFSLSAVTSGPAARVATSVGTSDTVKMFVIPANHVVLAARLEIVVPGTGSGTVALTDGTNTLAGVLAVTSAAGTQTNALTPRFYGTDTAVSIAVATAAVASGAYRVVVLAVDMTGQETTTLVTG